MTKDEFIGAVEARFDKHDAAFKHRIEAAIPVGISRVAGEFQWEFLDKYTTFSTATSTDDAAGKTVLSLPSDFSKFVVLFDDNQELEYRNRVAWAMAQIGGQQTNNPYYTIIGDELVLAGTWDGSTLYGVYTRTTGAFGIEDIPEHLQYAAMMAVVAYLAPSYVNAGDKLLPNPDLKQADRAYKETVGEAMRQESRNKGRVRQIIPNEVLRMRNDYT